MPDNNDKKYLDAEKRATNDARFDQSITMALESLSLAVNRYLLKRDACLMISDSSERKHPGTRDRKLDELKAGQYNLSVQLEHVLRILKTGKL